MELTEYLNQVLINSRANCNFYGDTPCHLDRWLVRYEIYEGEDTEKVFYENQTMLSFNKETDMFLGDIMETGWQYYEATKNHENNPNHYFQNPCNKEIYYLSGIYCEEETMMHMYTYMPSVARIRINGELLFENNFNYLYAPVTFMCKLNKGMNTILVQQTCTKQTEKLQGQSFFINMRPLEKLCKEKYLGNDFVKHYQSSYVIVPKDAVISCHEPIEIKVFPKWHEVGEEKDETEIEIDFFDDRHEPLGITQGVTKKNIVCHLIRAYEGVVKVQVLGRHDHLVKGTVHLLYGEFEHFKDKLMAQVVDLADEQTIYYATHLLNIVNMKTRCYKGTQECINNKLYDILFEKLFELQVYLREASEKSIYDISHKRMLIFRPSLVDGDFFCYGLYLPHHYTNGEKYPLIVNGGYGRGNSRYPIAVDYIRENRFEDFIVLDICARGELAHDFIYETELLRIIDEVKQRLDIDDKKVYYIGSCTAGIKGYDLANKYPSLFSGIATITSSPNRLVVNPYLEMAIARGGGGEIAALQNGLEESCKYLGNIRHTPVITLINTNDKSNNIASTISALEDNIHKEICILNDYGHLEFDELFNSNQIGQYLINNAYDKYPKTIHYASFYKQYNACYWIKKFKPLNPFNMSLCEARIESESQIHIDTQNIRALEVVLSKRHWGLTDKLSLCVNGKIILIEPEHFFKIKLSIQRENVDYSLYQLDEDIFDAQYHDINLEDTYLGIKGIYNQKCVILYPPFNQKEDMPLKELKYMLQHPFKQVLRDYKYDEQVLNESSQLPLENTILLVDLDDTPDALYGVLQQLKDIRIKKNTFSYKEQEYKDAKYALCKMIHPLKQEKSILIVGYRRAYMQDLKNFLYGLEVNPLANCEAIIQTDTILRSI